MDVGNNLLQHYWYITGWVVFKSSRGLDAQNVLCELDF